MSSPTASFGIASLQRFLAKPPDDQARAIKATLGHLFGQMKQRPLCRRLGLSPGGMLIIHDYANLCWDGPKQAVDEFVLGISECLVLMPDKSGTAVIRKSRAPDLKAVMPSRPSPAALGPAMHQPR